MKIKIQCTKKKKKTMKIVLLRKFTTTLKNQISNMMMCIRALGKQEHDNPKAGKEMIKVRAEINEMKMKNKNTNNNNAKTQ